MKALAHPLRDSSMSASDAKESITKGGPLKVLVAALQGLGAFGGGPSACSVHEACEEIKVETTFSGPQVAVTPPPP